MVAPILKDWTLPPMELWVIYPSGGLTSTKARNFVKWFEAIISEENRFRTVSGNRGALWADDLKVQTTVG